MLVPAVLQIIYKSKKPVTVAEICRQIKHRFRDMIPPRVSLKTAVIESTSLLCSFGFIVYDRENYTYKLLVNWQTMESATFQNRLRKILHNWPKPIKKKRYMHLKLRKPK